MLKMDTSLDLRQVSYSTAMLYIEGLQLFQKPASPYCLLLSNTGQVVTNLVWGIFRYQQLVKAFFGYSGSFQKYRYTNYIGYSANFFWLNRSLLLLKHLCLRFKFKYITALQFKPFLISADCLIDYSSQSVQVQPYCFCKHIGFFTIIDFFAYVSLLVKGFSDSKVLLYAGCYSRH